MLPNFKPVKLLSEMFAHHLWLQVPGAQVRHHHWHRDDAEEEVRHRQVHYEHVPGREGYLRETLIKHQQSAGLGFDSSLY